MDAFNDPNASSRTWPPTASAARPARLRCGCFSVVNEDGQASTAVASTGTTGWDVEESLDVDMVSAACPLCHIILVEANSRRPRRTWAPGSTTAVSLGAKFISNSYGGDGVGV